MSYMDKIEQLMNTEEFVQQMNLADSLEAVQALFAQNGVELTLDELKEMFVSAGEDACSELSEEALDNVAGGGFFRWLFRREKKKYKKLLNDMRD